MAEQLEIPIDELHEESYPFRYSITSYGADFDVEGLVRRLNRGDIYVPPFQRGYVWDINQASRFIESLLLGLPIPGIFLAKDMAEQYVVIDGQQRLYSLLFFYEGKFVDGRDFGLRGVQPEYHGLTYETLRPEDRRRLDNSIIHATIVRQDEPDDGNSSVYLLFERLNTGGVKLQPQEIRSALYHGKFNEVLETLNNNEAWRSIYGSKSARLRDQELILRFLALYFDSEHYARPMTAFLNHYMHKNRDLQFQDGEILERVFSATIETINNCVGKRAFKRGRTLNAAIFDAVMVGVARRLGTGPVTNCPELSQRYDELLNDEVFVQTTSKATADEASVSERIKIAVDYFANTP